MKVSVIMVTYNHFNYLLKAIEGVLMQKTNFNFELVIANDKSPDDSDLLIKKILETHPEKNKITYLNNIENIGMMKNFINALKNSKGEYIALCDGDDYWTDELKLQKQIDFLDENPDYAICFHKVNIKENDNIVEDTITLNKGQTTTINDLALGNYMHTCSVIYRNYLFETFPDYFYTSPIGDYFLHLLNSRYGKIYCINEVMATYRVHEKSYWSSKEQKERTLIWIDFLKNIKANFDDEIKHIIELQILNNMTDVIEIQKNESFFSKIITKLGLKKLNM